jgi:hypothetical protein
LFETVSNEDVSDMLSLIHSRTLYRFKNDFNNINDIPLGVFLDYIWMNSRNIRNSYNPDEVILGEGCTADTVNCAMGGSCTMFYKPETVESIIKTYINPSFSIQGYNFNEYSTDYWWWECEEEAGMFRFSGYTGPVRDIIKQSFPIVEAAYLVDGIYHIKIIETYLHYSLIGGILGIYIDDDEVGTLLYESQFFRANEWWQNNTWTPEMLNLNEAFNHTPKYLYAFKRNEQGLMNIYSKEII